MLDTDPKPDLKRAASVADWLRLQHSAGLGRKGARKLLDVFGTPGQVFTAGYDALAAVVPAALARTLCAPPAPATGRLAEATLAWLAQPSCFLLTLLDPGYPAALSNIPDPPLLLYLKGRPELLCGAALAVVGSRNASGQGMANADAFACALSGAGLAIVSGLALGIDTAAHGGALRAPGSTVAVIGTGIDQVYPPRNAALSERIGSEGCIVSEYSLGTPPEARNFPRRNRIISGLSRGVLVVEAAARSGSLITAHLAAEQGRDVFAIPGSIHSALSKGCHSLIKEGAKLVESAADVLEELRLAPPAPAAMRHDGCAALAGHGALLAALGHDPADADTLAARTGSEPGQLSAQLLMLELAGQVERLPGGLFQRLAP